jgi:hypothetical protein
MTRVLRRLHAPSDFWAKAKAWVPETPYLLTWLPGALAALYFKYAIMSRTGFDVAAGEMGKRTLTFLDRLSFFRNDFLFVFLLIPGGLFAFAHLFPRRWRAGIVSGFSIACVIIFYFETVCYSAVGRPLSFSLARQATAWGWMDPASVRAYLTRGLVHTTGLVLSAVVLWWWGARRSKVIMQDRRAERRWRWVGLAAVLTLTVCTAISWAPRAIPTPYHESIFVMSAKDFVSWRDKPDTEFGPLRPPELVRAYRGLTGAPSPEKDYRYWGKARGSDLVFFVFETGDYRFIPIDGNLDDFPNLRHLRERSFVAPQHYSTYPETSRALFSLFASWYPSSLAYTFVQEHINLAVPGIMRTLRALGYTTAEYSPFVYESEDDRMFENVGIERRLVATNFTRSIPGEFGKRLSLDRDALNLLTQDMDRWETQEHPFAAAFLPESGHYPWPSIGSDEHVSTVVRRGQAAMAPQDAFLGQLVRLLETHHRLEQTIIVVTADHGARTADEDPSLPSGMVDEYSFHVPLLIYAPQVLNHPETTPWLTSHIDVAPSVLDLLGVERERDPEQGSPIWDSRLQERTTFFFGNHYCGADGYYSHGQFLMRNEVFKAVYQNDRMHFASSNAVPAGSPRYQEVSTTIQRMVGLVQAWAVGANPAR